ncbi:MAG: acetyl ornithine aminotransferase family protein [Planctomycetota bacterium]
MLMRDRIHDAPHIVTSLPGPKAAQLIEMDERYTSPSYTRVYPLAVAKGEGAVIEDVDGNRFLDFNAGIAVCATGHCHPRVVKAIQEQASRLIHMSGTDFYYGPQAELARKLAELAPGAGNKRVFFTNSGTEAVEAAFKLARYHTKRKHMIAFFGAFHGRSMGALSLTASKVTQRSGFAPLIPQVSHVDYPNCYRCPLRLDSGCCFDCLDQLENQLFKRTISPDEVAAIFVEPIQGEGGYIVPPPEFHQRLKALTQRHGILLIADEVQSGMGRTGKMFAMEHWGVEPDIICLAKGIASGMPLGAIIARDDIMDWPPGSHASTFGGNPVSCAAALETIALLEEGLIANATRMGDYLIERLRDLQTRHPLIGDVRGKGLMIAAELVCDRATKEPAVAERNIIVQDCFRRGLLLLGCGVSSIRFSPPLVIDQADVDTAVEILDEVMSAMARAS